MTPRPEDLPPHLRYTTTSRGALHMPELYTHAHGALHLSESTSAPGAYVWLRASAALSLDQPLADRHEVVLHVSLDDLELLMEQCEFVIDYHRNTVRRGAPGKVAGDVASE